MCSAELFHAYQSAIYRVNATPPFDVRVGDRSESADDLLPAGCESWAFITACNPGSRPRLTDDQNAERTQSLRAMLNGWKIIDGEGHSQDNEWREPSFLVLGIDEARASEIALAFGQAAYVAGTRGGVARLVLPG